MGYEQGKGVEGDSSVLTMALRRGCVVRKVCRTRGEGVGGRWG